MYRLRRQAQPVANCARQEPCDKSRQFPVAAGKVLRQPNPILRAFNEAITGIADAKPLHARLRNVSGAIIAAITGHTWGGCCEIAQLWVREDERGRGHGDILPGISA